MHSSPTIGAISKALVKAQSEMSTPKKDAVNPFFKKNYADLNSVLEACMPALNNNQISVLQPICVIDGIDYVETILLHDSGEWIGSFAKIINDKANDAQRQGSGISYARRYGLQSLVNLGAEDDDANGATVKKPAAPSAPPKFAPKPAVSNDAFDKAIERIKKGEKDLVEKMEATYTLTDMQKVALKALTLATTTAATELDNDN